MINEGEEETETPKAGEPATFVPSRILEGEAVDVPDNVYPGPLGIWKNTNLTDVEQRVEQAFAEQLQSDVAYWMQEYLRRNERLLSRPKAKVRRFYISKKYELTPTAYLAAGKNVQVIFVHRPFETAVRGVIDRAISTGRAVPLNVLAGDHYGASKTVLQVATACSQISKV